MIVVTGAAGFIGSCLVAYLNELGYRDLWLVDDFQHYPDKSPNLEGKNYQRKSERTTFLQDLRESSSPPSLIFHMGARTDTAEQDVALFDELNLNYTKALWNYCVEFGLPLVYASSAATYGGGELGYDDRHDVVEQLQPLNPYGRSKNDFDKWALAQDQQPPRWFGLKFFNIYGPNEYHKGRMASVVWHAFRQIMASGAMKLFRSHRADIADGQQSRDFVYVKDLCRVLTWLAFEASSQAQNGLYNLGTGQTRPFIDLVDAVFNAMDQAPKISFIDTPADIRDTYQYYTQAEMRKLRAAGYPHDFHSLEAGVEDYVKQYLIPTKYY